MLLSKLRDLKGARGVTAILILFAMIEGTRAARGTYAMKLVDDLFLDYESSIRPVNNTNDAITVNFAVFLFQILELDERNQILTAYLWLRQEWKDANLAWNPKKYDGLETIRLPSKKIWLPDIVLYNNADETFTKNLQTNVILKSNGEVRWDQPAITKTSCQMDVSLFPFDSQSCVFTFGSWTYYLEHLDISPTQQQGNRDDFVPNVEWKVSDMPVKRIVEKYSCCPDPYPIIQINLELQRKSTFYIFNLLLPCVFISLLLPLTFCLPAESGEKVSLGITTLLAMTVFQLLVAESMPPSEAVPLIGKYYITTMALMSLSTAMTIFVQNIHFCGPNPPPVPRWMQTIILLHLARFLNIKINPCRKSAMVVDPRFASIGYRSKFAADDNNQRKLPENKRQDSIKCDGIGEDTPFLPEPKGFPLVRGKEGIPERGEEKKSNSGWRTMTLGVKNLVASVPRVRYTGSVQGPASGEPDESVCVVNDCQQRYDAHKPDAMGRRSWPSIAEYRVASRKDAYDECLGAPPVSRMRPGDYLKQHNRLSAREIPPDRRMLTAYHQQSSSTTLPITPSEAYNTTNATQRRRRNTFVQMNTAKSFDYSDDTEVSLVTPTQSESPRPQNEESSPAKAATIHRVHSQPNEPGIFYVDSSTSLNRRSWSNTRLGQLSKSQVGLDFEGKNGLDFTKTSNCQCKSMTEMATEELRYARGSLRRGRETMPQAYKRRHNESGDPPPSIGDDEFKPVPTVRFQACSTQTTPSDDTPFTQESRTYTSVAQNIGIIADHFKRQRCVVETTDEWKNVSRVCDRGLMWIFVIVQILFSTLILCKII